MEAGINIMRMIMRAVQPKVAVFLLCPKKICHILQKSSLFEFSFEDFKVEGSHDELVELVSDIYLSRGSIFFLFLTVLLI